MFGNPARARAAAVSLSKDVSDDYHWRKISWDKGEKAESEGEGEGEKISIKKGGPGPVTGAS